MSFATLAAKTTSISAPYQKRIAEDDELWDGSPFDWIRRLPSRTRGSIGQELSRFIFDENGYKPAKRKNSFEVSGTIIISRSSMLWEGDHWAFQQVRNTSFDFLFCLGLYPDSASAWLIPKGELYDPDGNLQDKEGWGRQHGGKSGKEDAWLTVYPNSVPAWLGKFGGEVSFVPAVLKRLLPSS